MPCPHRLVDPTRNNPATAQLRKSRAIAAIYYTMYEPPLTVSTLPVA